MELTELIAFLTGAALGGSFIGFGVVIGVMLEGGSLRKKVVTPEYDPTEAPMDDDYFEKATLAPDAGGHEFPNDRMLEDLHRHSTHEVIDA